LQKLVVAYQAELIRDEKVLGLELFEQLSKIIRDDPSQKEKLVQEVARFKKESEVTLLKNDFLESQHTKNIFSSFLDYA